mgnify:CR=1 FL=1
MTCGSARTTARHQQSPPQCRDEAEPLILDQPEPSGCRSFQTVYRVVLSAMALGARAGYLWWLVAAARLPNTESEHFDASPVQLASSEHVWPRRAGGYSCTTHVAS